MAQEGREITIKDIEKVLLNIYKEPKKQMNIIIYGEENIKAYQEAMKNVIGYGKRG